MKYKLLIGFNLIYLLGFTIYYISIGNLEFLWYLGIMFALFAGIAGTLKYTNLSKGVLWGLSIWGLLHVLGGGLRIGGEVLYAKILIDIISTSDYTILRFDQFVHAYFYFVAFFALYQIFKPVFLARTDKRFLLYFASALAAIGIGALNEVGEFMAVLFFPETGVGGYFNNAWDLVFNLIGVLLAIAVSVIYNRKKN